MTKYLLETTLILALIAVAIWVPVSAHAQSGDLVVTGQGGQPVVQSGNMQIAISPFGSTIVVQPLDAPGNPYTRQYTNVDRWVYNNFDPQFTTRETIQQGLREVQRRNPAPADVGRGASPGNPAVPETPGRFATNADVIQNLRQPQEFQNRVRVMVDPQGFLIPQSDPRVAVQVIGGVSGSAMLPADPAAQPQVNVEVNVQPEGDGAEPATEGEDGVVAGVSQLRESPSGVLVEPEPYFFYTQPMPEDQLGELRETQIAIVARELPVIPAWVTEHAPRHVMFLPNGNVVLDVGESGTTHVIYTSTGERVTAVATAADLPAALASNFPQIQAQAEAKGYEVVTTQGYIVLRNRENRKIEALFDWDGKPLALETTLQPRPYYFTPLRWEGVQEITQAQRRVPAAGREPGAQQTSGTTGNVQQGHDTTPDQNPNE